MRSDARRVPHAEGKEKERKKKKAKAIRPCGELKQERAIFDHCEKNTSESFRRCSPKI